MVFYIFHMKRSPAATAAPAFYGVLAGLLLFSACHHARPVVKPPAAPDTVEALVGEPARKGPSPDSLIVVLKSQIDSLSQVHTLEGKTIHQARIEVDVYKSLLLQADQNYLAMTRSLASPEAVFTQTGERTSRSGPSQRRSSPSTR